MLQIKTIVSGTIPEFDKEVNEAIADSWHLIKRDCLLIGREHAPMFYAELEKVVITEDERTCENCKHYDLDARLEPCCSCSNSDIDKWEAAE